MDLDTTLQRYAQSPTPLHELKPQLVAGGSATVNAVNAFLPQADDQAAYRLATLLGEVGNVEGVDALIKLLHRDHRITQQAAAMSLARIGGDTTIDALLERLDTTQISSRPYIVQAIGQLKDPRTVDRLLQLLDTTPDHVLIYTTIDALASIGDPRALPKIRELLDHPNHHVRDHAEMAVQQLDD